MILTEEQLEQIEKYISQQMTDSEKILFENQLNNDAKLSKIVEQQRKMLFGFEVIEMKRQIKEARPVSSTKTPIIVLQQPYFLAAASIAIFFLVGWLLFRSDVFTPNTTLAYNEFYKPETNARNNDCPQNLVAFKSYQAGNYTQALGKSENIADDSTYCIAYFRGINYLALNQTTKAIQLLETASRSKDETIAQKSEWYLGLTYLKAGEESKAKEVFGNIQKYQDAENPYRLPSQALLQKYFSK
jgi:hypothetical protein